MSAPRILIVDDNLSNLKLLRILLTGEGFEILTASGGEEALSCVPVFKPDLVLADLQMPGMDGLALTRKLKADPATKGVLVVALTAYAMPGDRAKALAAGCDDYFTKPIDTRSLPGRLRDLAQGR